jgi:hypothetical protein
MLTRISIVTDIVAVTTLIVVAVSYVTWVACFVL